MAREGPLPGERQELIAGQSAWPTAFARLSPPPESLRIAGRSPPWPRSIAIVGTRYADQEALDFARRLAGELARAGCSIVSGGAHGIDGAAHEGALEVGGTTVAVLAHGFDLAYPRLHRPLFERIVASRGALATERPDGSPLRKASFVQRNRLIAALSEAVVVVQAPARSGALSTAACAMSLDIPVFAVPMAPWIVRGEGNLRLLAGGARICTCARDVLSVRPSEPAPAPASPSRRRRAPERKRNNLQVLAAGIDDDDCKLVYGALGTVPSHVDELIERLALPMPRLQRALLELVLSGLARDNGNGAYEAMQVRPRNRP